MVRPAIHKSSNYLDNYAIFGFKLTEIKSKILTNDPDSLFRKHQQELSNFINMLYDPERNVTFALRYIINPNQQYYSLGNIKIILLIKLFVDTMDDEESINRLLGVIKPLLGSSFSNYTWQEIVEDEELEKYISPIDWNAAHFSEIRRREEQIHLDTTLPVRPIGFGNENEEVIKDENDYIFYVHPYVTPLNGFQKAVKTLFRGKNKIILTTLLTPTQLTEQEKEYLLDQIAKCEAPSANEKKTIRVQYKQANLLTRGLLRQYLSLEDAPFYMTFTVASDKPLDRLILEMIGLGISEPIGQNIPPANISDEYFFHYGGYDVILPKNDAEREISKKNMTTLSQTPWGDCPRVDEQKRLRFLFDGTEATSAFFLPINIEEDLPGINTFYFKENPIPREMMEISKGSNQKILLGKNSYFGFEQDVVISEDTRKQHTYIIGQTGTGKSTLLKSMILSDIKAGHGLAVIDPHGELYDDLLEFIPEERKNDIVLFNPSDTEYPVGFNLLQVKHDEEREAVVKEMRAVMKRYIFEYFDITQGEYAGPVFFQHLQNNMLLVSSDLDNPGTIIELYNIFVNENYWRRWLPLKWKNHVLEQWVENYLPNIRYLSKTSDGGISGDYFSSKLADFVNDPRISLIFGQPYSTINLKDIIENNKILLVNLSKGLLGEASSSLLGMILMAKFNTYFMERRKELTEGKPLPAFYLYVDEFQNIATENFSILLSEARKFGLGLILANQFIAQINDFKIREAIFGNVGTLISFRLGVEDANVIESQLLPHYNYQDLCNLPNYNAIIRTNIEGKRSSPCNFQTLIPSYSSAFCNKNEVIDISRHRYALPRKLAEFIVSSLQTGKRITKTCYYFEKDGTPKEELIQTLDILSALIIFSKGKKEYLEKAEHLYSIIKTQIIYHFLYEKFWDARRVSNVFELLQSSDPEQFFVNFLKIAISIASGDQQSLEELIGLYNYFIRTELLEELLYISDNFNSIDNPWFQEIYNHYNSDNWKTGITILLLHAKDVSELIDTQRKDFLPFFEASN